MARLKPYIVEIENYYMAFGKLHHSHFPWLEDRIREKGGTPPTEAKELILEAKRLGVNQ